MGLRVAVAHVVRAGALLVAAVLGACRDAAPPPAPPAPPPPRADPAPAYDPARGTATLRGVVRIHPLPSRPISRPQGEMPPEIAGSLAPGAGLEPREVNPDGSVPHAFVQVVEGPSLGLAGYPAADVEVDQSGYAFHPHVTGVVLGARVVFRNSDPCMHNVHLVSRPDGRWTETQPPGTTAEWRPERAGGAVRVVCDLHSWMSAWVHVLEHPFFATSARGDGAFEIRGLLPGRHRVRVWHETWAKDRPVEFEADLAPGENLRDVELRE